MPETPDSDDDAPTDDGLAPGSVGPTTDDPNPADTGPESGDEDDDGYLPSVDTDTAGDVGYWTGTQVGRMIATPPWLAGVALWKGAEGVIYGLSRALPRGSGFWQKWIKVGYKNLRRSAGADRINHVMKQGHILHRPIYWHEDRQRWETKGGTNWWNGGKQHLYQGPGGVPCSWGASEATELGDQVQAEVAEALELGYGADLYRNARVSINQMTIDADGVDSGNQAVADGGLVESQEPVMESTLSVDHPGFLEDQVVNLAALFTDADYDDIAEGRLVSMEKYYETYPEQVDSEEMQHQEDRGLLAQMNNRNTWKIALYCMALAFAFILLWEYGPQMLGMAGGGGGGGSLLPF